MKASIAAIFIAAALASPAAHSAEWKPTSTVEMVVPTSPGGAADRTGRLVQRLLQDRVGSDITVLNKGGAGGAVAYAYPARYYDAQYKELRALLTSLGLAK